MEEMQAQSLCWEDPLEEEMTTHSSILAGMLEIAGNFLLGIPCTEEPGGLLSRVVKVRIQLSG